MQAMLIVMIANYLIGAKIFDQIKALVAEQEKLMIAGVEKKHTVVAKAEKLGIQVTASLLNLAIELAVQWVRTQKK